MSKVFIVEGNPVPLARPRFNRNTASVYDSQREQRGHARLFLENQQNDEPLLEGPLMLCATFYMPAPSKMSPKKQRLLNGKLHLKTPDLDNLVKWLLDISQGIILVNDSCVCVISARKIYSDTPQTLFSFLRLTQ